MQYLLELSFLREMAAPNDRNKLSIIPTCNGLGSMNICLQK